MSTVRNTPHIHDTVHTSTLDKLKKLVNFMC